MWQHHHGSLSFDDSSCHMYKKEGVVNTHFEKCCWKIGVKIVSTLVRKAEEERDADLNSYLKRIAYLLACVRGWRWLQSLFLSSSQFD